MMIESMAQPRQRLLELHDHIALLAGERLGYLHLTLDEMAAAQVDVVQLGRALALDAQRRASEAQTKYYLSLSQYATSTKNVQYQQGTLLHAIHLMVIDEPPPPVSIEDVLLESVPPVHSSSP